jgi:hypothetical protein
MDLFFQLYQHLFKSFYIFTRESTRVSKNILKI